MQCVVVLICFGTLQLSSAVILHCLFIPPHCCSVLRCVAVCCGVLQCTAVCCSVLLCVAVCFNEKAMCNILQWIVLCCNEKTMWYSLSRLQCHFPKRAVCINVLQYCVVCCSVLQFVSSYRSFKALLKTRSSSSYVSFHCNNLQHFAIYCSTLHHTAMTCNTYTSESSKLKFVRRFSLKRGKRDLRTLASESTGGGMSAVGS